MSNPDLEAMLLRWTPILRLQDWTIRIVYKRHFDMADGKGGTIGWCLRKKTAWIKVLDPQDYQPNPEESIPPDVELTVVHELLHLHFALVDDLFSGIKEDLLEQSIHDISMALIALNRRGDAVKVPDKRR